MSARRITADHLRRLAEIIDGHDMLAVQMTSHGKEGVSVRVLRRAAAGGEWGRGATGDEALDALTIVARDWKVSL